MQQSDGSDLPGISAPNSADIGIIHVDPTDDRQSVLAAILTQDKLHRKQVVVVLSEQSKVFQRPIDFEGLKNMRRGLKAQVVFVAPSGPGPAEFARQRRFPVYSSLENYAKSLQEADRIPKRGVFAQPRPKTRQQTPIGPGAIAVGAAGAAAVLGIGALAARGNNSHIPSSPGSFLADDVPTQPNIEAPPPNSASTTASTTGPQPTSPLKARSSNSGKIPTPPVNQRNWRNIAAIGAVGATVGALAPVARARMVGSGGGVPPQGSTGGRSGAPASPPPGRGRPLLLALAVLLAALLVVGGISLALPGGGPLGPLVPGVSPSATVTITPASTDLKNSYVIFGVTGTPDATQRQVQARKLSFTTPSQSKTANATGIANTPGVQATGNLTFFNGSSTVQTVGSGTHLTGADGVAVITNEPAVIPAANPPTEGSVTISAHAAAVGGVGNIGSGDINGTCCFAGNFVTVRNAQFGGGADPQHYTFVQQSDIDNAAKPLENTLTPSAQQSLQSQVHSNEKLISSPQCVPNVTSNHAAGDRNVSNVTVSVKVACTGEVYDQQATQTIVANLLKQEATTNPGPGYALVGNLVTSVTQITVTDATKGTLSLLTKAEGIWVYQFNDAQKQMLAQLIAGKSKQDAQTLLMQQAGIKNVTIQLNGGDGKTLPAANQITIVVQSVPGVQGPTSTPTTVPGATPSVGLG